MPNPKLVGAGMADTSPTGRFFLRETPYTKKRWGERAVKSVVHIEIWMPQESSKRQDAPLAVHVVRPMTEQDKITWPEAWAEYESTHG